MQQRIRPLEIAGARERRIARKAGKMVFYHDVGNATARLELPLNKDGSLQGVYKTNDGSLYSLRASPHRLFVFTVRPIDSLWHEKVVGQFLNKGGDLAHMLLPLDLRKTGFAEKGALKADKDVRSRTGGSHTFSQDYFPTLPLESEGGATLTPSASDQIGSVLRRIGYTNIAYNQLGTSSGPFGIAQGVKYWSKTGKSNPKDDLSKYHRIEAIDPKTKRIRVYTYRIRPNKSA